MLMSSPTECSGRISTVRANEKGPRAMYEIRKEKRNPEKLQVLLSRMVEPLLTQAASTDNVSSHGMRVRTDGHWKRDTHLIVQPSEYVLWARAKVVYCQPLSDKTFAVGLELLARTGDWIMRASRESVG